ncbi:MAG: glutamate synthase [Anaerolineae bacterium]|jgi:glutamate synthase domain-containing protein 1/glutamate synthase domain-containing protein 3
MNSFERIIDSRRDLVADLPLPRHKAAEEGGCGVVGLAASVPVAGRHLVAPARQMHNRGNGKGGGLAAAGLTPAQMGVPSDTLRQATLLQIAYLDPEARADVEREALLPHYELFQGYAVPTVDDYRDVPGLEVRPPDVWRYFVRARPEALARFAGQHGLEALDPRRVEDEFIYRNSFRLNRRFYAGDTSGGQLSGAQRAFVLSHGRDLLVFKIVGYAEQAAAYYQLEDLAAHVWIAHQRYPTKGRVWHPGGAHPFVGLNEALVHNGDFANYYAVATYLRQRNIAPLFLTDTEVSVLLFDLLDRVYDYPLEATIEALAPTTERDFALLPPDKQHLYRAVQATHLHASPDGPWFFIIARSRPDRGEYQLLGITDTSMLRPQVFALHEGKVQVALVASEKQAIDAALESLAGEDERICPVADRYWNARGGSHTDGGTFVFTVKDGQVSHQGSRTGSNGNGHNKPKALTVTDKFGVQVTAPADQFHNNPSTAKVAPATLAWLPPRPAQTGAWLVAGPEGVEAAWQATSRALGDWDYGELTWFCQRAVELAGEGDEAWAFALALVTRLRDRQYDPGSKRRASVLALVDRALAQILDGVPGLVAPRAGRQRRVTWQTRQTLRPPGDRETVLVLDAAGFPPEGDEAAARLIVQAAALGWRRIVTYRWRGGRFCGCGLGPGSQGIRIDVYGASGDYLGSGLQGAEVHVHGSAQDQVGQILKAGKLVVHGDVGQTFMYGAKGGQAYVLGSAAGRPLINAAGSPRVVINGTCLDYLAESFMAGDPLDGGGFVVLNGITFDAHGRLVTLETPYPGGNLFSLASGGAIYVRDPWGRVEEDQLNGGALQALSPADWALIRPYLVENARLFGISVEALLTVEGQVRPPEEVYRKVTAVKLANLA